LRRISLTSLVLSVTMAITAVAALPAQAYINMRGGVLIGETSVTESGLKLSSDSIGYYMGADAQLDKVPVHLAASYQTYAPTALSVSLPGVGEYELQAGTSVGHVLAGYGREPLAAGIGWTSAVLNLENAVWGQDVTLLASGPALGLMSRTSPTERVQLAGELVYVPSAHLNVESAFLKYEAGKSDLWGLALRGSVELWQDLRLEMGYNTSRMKVLGAEVTTGGYQIGGRYVF